ncbi:MAG: PilZ domain-containing protein [Gammaproteobacteria bacterium]|nr:PilZ domain-containing protein [Gammaproteobacteria bacterium]
MSVVVRDTHLMDHRFGCRHSIRTTVILVMPDGDEVSGSLRDISMSGAFVETDARSWRSHLPVELRLGHQTSSDRERMCAEAMVVRSTWDGVAVMFGSVNPPFLAPLITVCESVRGAGGSVCPTRATDREIDDRLQIENDVEGKFLQSIGS